MLTNWRISFAQTADLSLREPPEDEKAEENLPLPIDVKKIPNFPTKVTKKEGSQRIQTNPTTIPIDTRLRIAVDSSVNVKTSLIGDYFKAHILEDFYLPTNPPQLIVPKGSWIRGKISFIKKPNIFNKTGKIGLHLDQLITPFGEIVFLNGELDVEQGILNGQGFLDPPITSQTKALVPNQIPPENNLEAVTIPQDNIGPSAISSLLSGSLPALFSQWDNISLNKGQELQVVLRKDVQLGVD